LSEPTGVRRDAASLIFNLPDYRVIEATDVPGGARRVLVESGEPPGCPACGVVATRVDSRRRQRIRDVAVAGAVEVLWCKWRWFCDEHGRAAGGRSRSPRSRSRCGPAPPPGCGRCWSRRWSTRGGPRRRRRGRRRVVVDGPGRADGCAARAPRRRSAHRDRAGHR